MKKILRSQLLNLALPLLVTTYPIIFLYSVNAWNLTLQSLAFPLGASLLVTVIIFYLFQLLHRDPVSAALASVIFMLIYFGYGSLYRGLVVLNLFRVQHFWLLPLVIALAVYLGYLHKLIKPPVLATINKILTLVALVLVSYNLLSIGSVEVRRNWLKPATATTTPTSTPSGLASTASMAPGTKYPDIYYIIFDEYAGFDAIRGYWKDNYVNAFEDFLHKDGFFVADGSRSVTINTETELATRFNLHQYTDQDDPKAVLQMLDNNKVMQVVKSYGYTTVTMDMAFNGINADDNIQFNPQEVGGMAIDEYKQTFINNSMFYAFSDYFNYGSNNEKQRDMIMFALNKTVSLTNVKSPKFVFTHVLLPHLPFIFDENGNMIDPLHSYDWHYYLGQHKYTTKLAENLITQLLKNADPNNPPVIIVQSDHGARNLASRTASNIILDGYLPDYNIDYAHMILNALYLPGMDTSTLSNNMPPIDTFEIVLNHYLNAGLSVDQTK